MYGFEYKVVTYQMLMDMVHATLIELLGTVMGVGLTILGLMLAWKLYCKLLNIFMPL